MSRSRELLISGFCVVVPSAFLYTIGWSAPVSSSQIKSNSSLLLQITASVTPLEHPGCLRTRHSGLGEGH